MKFTEARIVMINDDEMLNQLFADRFKFRKFPFWHFETTLESGLSYIQVMGTSNKDKVNVLLLDENLKSGGERNDGLVLYEAVLQYDLQNRIAVASMSKTPQLPITHVVPDGQSIEAFIGGIVLG